MITGIPKETFPGENRVALIPDMIRSLTKAGLEVIIESGAGENAGFSDDLYLAKGAGIVKTRKELYSTADIILQVRGPGANPEKSSADMEIMREGQVIIGYMEPYTEPEIVSGLAAKGTVSFAMELMPRITRAQSMDSLSSMATIAGYKAVLIAAGTLPKMFPMMMTAAGTVKPARVFIIGAGVAGLQAIASSKRLGAVVQAYDVRPVVKEQVESLGGKFVEMEIDASGSEDKGGYAKVMDEEFYRKQRELMTKVISENDVVITTAAVPGKKAPILITEEMVKGMAPGSVIVDIAAERGGNCELTKPGESINVHGVTILGPLNIPSDIPFHSSQMYSKNITNFLLSMIKEGKPEFNMEDEIVSGTILTKGGKIVNAAISGLLNK